MSLTLRSSEVSSRRLPINSLFRILRFLARTSWRALACYGLLALVLESTLQVNHVVSGSMSPTLIGENWQAGDVVISTKQATLPALKRWDVVVVVSPGRPELLKRVVALPGEEIHISATGLPQVDGKTLQPPEHLDFLHYYPAGRFANVKSYHCDQGYFLLGDDSQDSDDSRYCGEFDPSAITGRALWIISPWDRMGPVR